MSARRWPLLFCMIAAEGGPWWNDRGDSNQTQVTSQADSWQRPAATPSPSPTPSPSNRHIPGLSVTPAYLSPSTGVPTPSPAPFRTSTTKLPFKGRKTGYWFDGFKSSGSNSGSKSSSNSSQSSDHSDSRSSSQTSAGSKSSDGSAWWTRGFFKHQQEREHKEAEAEAGAGQQASKSSASSSSPPPPPPPPPPTPPPQDPADSGSSATTPQGTCKEFGCNNFVRGHGCQCNLDCWRWNDCCSDFQPLCLQLGKDHLPDITLEVPCFFKGTIYRVAKTGPAPTAAACQAICAKDKSCKHFTWSSNQKCSLAVGDSEIVAVNQSGSISGPAKCAVQTKEPVLLKALPTTTIPTTTTPAPTVHVAWKPPSFFSTTPYIVPFPEANPYDRDEEDTAASIKQEEEDADSVMKSLEIPDCAGGGRMYLPDIPGHPPQLVAGPMACQHLCAKDIPDCQYFSFTYGGWCHFASGSAQPVPTGIEDDMSGPRSCAGAETGAKTAAGTTGLYSALPTVLKSMGSSTTYTLFGALAAVSGLFWGTRVLFSGRRCDTSEAFIAVDSSLSGDQAGFFSRQRLSRSLLGGSSSRHVPLQVLSEYQALSLEETEAEC